MKTNFFEKLDRLDNVIAQGHSNLDTDDLKELLTDSQTADYFYSHIDSPDWLPILRELGEFANPPAPITSLDGKTITYPRWSQMKYIKKIADKSPDSVVNLLLSLPDLANPRIYDDVIEAGVAMPPSRASSLTPVLLPTLQQRARILFPDGISKLVTHLLEGGETSSALKITEAFLSLEIRVVAAGSPIKHRDLTAVVDKWEYAEFLKTVLPVFARIAGQDFCKALIDLINKALRLLSEDGKPYRVLRPTAIEQHEQNEYADDFLEVLIFALRDASDESVKIDGLAAVLDLESQPSQIFRRIAIYLRDKYSLLNDDGAVSLLTDTTVLTNYESHHEIYNLMQNHFEHLPTSVQRAYLAVLDTIDANHIDDPSRREKFIRHSRYQYLYPIAAFLEEPYKQQFEDLRNEFGHLDHPDFLIYHSGVSMVESTPPLAANALAEMPDESFIAYCKDFNDPGDRFNEPIRGLAMEAAQLLDTQTERMIALAPRFKALRPDFSYFYLSKLTQKLKAGAAFDINGWAAIVELCDWVTIQFDNSDLDNHEARDLWRSARQQLATFLDTAFEKGSSDLPKATRERMICIVKRLAEDPDPSLEREASPRTTYGDIAINSVSGIAMEAAVHYGLWRYRICQESGLEWRGLDSEPELKSILQRALETKREPRLTIRSVLGRFVPWLHLLDSQWTLTELTNIFPRSSSLLPFRRSAWGAYVAFCPPFKDIVPLLESEYRWAIEEIGTWGSDHAATFDVDERLAEHLMISVWNGTLSDRTQLVTAFFARAPQELRAYSIDFIGRSLKRGETDADVIRRLQSLWQWRMSEISSHKSEASKEASEFSSWITSGVFDHEWLVEQLRQIVRLKSSPSRESDLMEHLLELLPFDPETVLSYVSTAVTSDDSSWRIHSIRKDLHKIFLRALELENSKARQQVHEMVNKLGEIGFLEFRDISKASA